MRPSGYLTRPDYHVDILRRRNCWRVMLDGSVLADSRAALIVDEQDHALVVYFPPSAVVPGALVPVDVPATYCPYKGTARYWASSAAPLVPIAWSYDEPYPEVAAIAGHVAFYADRATVALVGDTDKVTADA